MDGTNDVASVQGFKASAVPAGLKKDNSLDMALIFSEKEATAAGVFTTNRVKAAPILLTREHIAAGKARAIIANAGNANACTGEAGINDARRTAELVAEALGINPDEVLVSSTGVIGQTLDMKLISDAVPDLVGSLSKTGMASAAQAIMTTDSFPKISQFEGRVGEHIYRIQGIAKGAGMIMPNMATMLCFIMSDIVIGTEDLKKALLTSVEESFNRITVDGDTSTNDMVLVLANGMAGNGRLTDMDFHEFINGLSQVMGELARMIVRDGEGATKVVNIRIKGAHSALDAMNAARTVANSSLVKTAFYGEDPNWGRIMAALGRAGIQIDEGNVNIFVNDIQIVSNGLGKGFEAEKKAAEQMALKEFSVTINLNQGSFQDWVISCDLTHDYVSINADYRT
ncbi:MAG: bifunctional glutamate N-acetyltransferase/amino-acid acetyltransferase ArgJ [Deltaproteobacteria bacterium]|nr:bifunctional glutamate N-acetyltransferase/amino-acid acetyltransferase ArgJ [Deltaproteobacteria bacterium]